MLLQRQGDMAKLHKENNHVAIFNLRYGSDVQKLQTQVKGALDLAMNHEKCIVNCDTMEVEIYE